MDTLLSLEHEREQVSGTFHEALVEPNEDISGLRRCMRPPPPPPKHRAAPLDGRPDRWLLVESVPNLPGLPQPWGSPLCHLPHVLPLPVPKPHPVLYARCLYKQNCTTPLSVFFVAVFLEVGWDVFFSSFPLLFSYDLMTLVLHLNSFFFSVYIYDNRLLVCCDHETLIQQSTLTCMIVLSC